MPTLQLNNVPESVMAELRRIAEQEGVSVEEEATGILGAAITGQPPRTDIPVQSLLDRAQRVREKHPNAWVTEEFLRAAKDEGRA